MEPREQDKFDFSKDFGKGDLADVIPIEPFSEDQLIELKETLSDLYFNLGATDQPRGPIINTVDDKKCEWDTSKGKDKETEKDEELPDGWRQRNRWGNFPAPFNQPLPKKPKVIPCDNVIIDESGENKGRDGGKVIEIPPGLKNCIFTQVHETDNGEGWTVIIRIKNGRMKQVVVMEENGRRNPVHRRVGEIIKVHKDDNKIVVVGKKRVCTYFIKTNRLVCVP